VKISVISGPDNTELIIRIMKEDIKPRRSGLLYEELTHKIIATAMEVHKELGCGFLEPVYEEPFSIELQSRNIDYENQKELEIHYTKARCCRGDTNQIL